MTCARLKGVCGRRRPLAIAAAVGLILAPQAARAHCQRPRIFFNFGTSNVQETWRVNKNEACSHTIRTWGGGGDYGVTNIAIARPAAHGLAGASNSMADHGYAYRPAQGFTGKDHFTATLDQVLRGATRSTTVEVDIEVVNKP